ncbi:hypothetical protein BDD12DRAFT_981630 [Trichophaea hybrida]|nr:hypothetical protein BDD12DRAFT_981630 [Trichophaea hybrida]
MRTIHLRLMLIVVLMVTFCACGSFLPVGKSPLLPPDFNSTWSNITDYPSWGNFPEWFIAGLGMPAVCEIDVNGLLGHTSEVDKCGSAAATTIFTLLPSLLTFTPLPTASIDTLFYLSPTAAFLTAGMTLGLPIQHRSTINPENIISATELAPGDWLEFLGGQSNYLLQRIVDIHKFRSYVAGFPPHIRTREQRVSVIYTIAYIALFCLLQSGLYSILLNWIFYMDTLWIVWLCPDISSNVFGSWLFIAFFTAAVAKLASETAYFAPFEIFHLTPLPTAISDEFFKCQTCSIMEWPTPSRIPQQRLQDVLRSLGKTCCSRRSNGDSPRLDRSLPRFSLRSVLSQALNHEHPTVVVLRLSAKSRQLSPVRTILKGYFQAMMLLSLTFLFASIVGSTLLWATLVVATIISSVSASRGLSLWISRLLVEAAQLTIIECTDNREMKGMARLLVSIPGLLIESKTDGYSYSGGYRLDSRHYYGQPDGLNNLSEPLKKAVCLDSRSALCISIALSSCVIMVFSAFSIYCQTARPGGFWDDSYIYLYSSILWVMAVSAILFCTFFWDSYSRLTKKIYGLGF